MPKPNLPPPPGENPRDTYLLEQLAQARARGDRDAETEAVGQLLAGWLPRVEALARFRGLPSHQVGDVVGRWAERMLKALAKRTSFDGPFGAVAMLNARWACTDEHRAAADRSQLRADPLAVEPHALGASDDAPDLLEAVDDALAGLSARDRALIDGVIGDGQPYKEIAAELGIIEGAAKTAVCRALGKLRRALSAAGVTNRGRPPV